MDEKVLQPEKKRVVKPYAVFALGIAGILINFLGARLAQWLGLPLYLDTIGTILAAALGGFLPGPACQPLDRSLISAD